MAGNCSPFPRRSQARGANQPGETVLITGASSGIGRELARLFAGDGAELVLVARSGGRLRELAGQLAAEYGARARVVPADLSQPAGPGEIIQALAQQHIEVDVLVNNAVLVLLHRAYSHRQNSTARALAGIFALEVSHAP